MSDTWFCIAVRFDGTALWLGWRTTAEIDMVATSRPDAYGWNTTVVRDDIVIEEWYGHHEPHYYRHSIYIRQ